MLTNFLNWSDSHAQMLALVLIFENIGVDRIIMQNILVNGVSFSNIRFLLARLAVYV